MLVITLVLNLLVAAAKGVYGVWTGSLAIATDAIHSLVDGASNVIGLFVVGIARRPPDEGHPYGHRKVEIVAAAVIGVAIGAAGVRFAWTAIEALIDGRAAPHTSAIGFAVIAGTMIVNIFVATYEARKARELESTYLGADAAHTASDVLVTGAVMVAYTAAHLGVSWADPVGALVVLAIICVVAWRILSSNINVLLDSAAVDAALVESIAIGVEGVVGCHRVRSRGAGGTVHVDLHIQLEADITLRAAHDIAHTVEDGLRRQLAQNVDVTIHMEPHDDEDERL